jgi:hypothetical protein
LRSKEGEEGGRSYPLLARDTQGYWLFQPTAREREGEGRRMRGLIMPFIMFKKNLQKIHYPHNKDAHDKDFS